MRIRKLTVKQLRKAMEQFPYLLVWDGTFRYGINSKIAMLGKMKSADDKTVTKIISFHPIDFQEYITNKITFI